MRKYSLIFFSLVVGCLLFSSCTDEELANKGAGNATKISLSFETPAVEQIVTKGVNEYTLIESLYLFIFDSNGDIEGDAPLLYNLNSSESSGTIASEIPMTTGNHYIFAIANPKTSFASVEGLESIATKREFLSKTASLKGDLLLSGNLIPMVGTVLGADADGMINITAQGSYKVRLERILASVKFDVSCGNSSATFDLKSYEVINYPSTTNLWEDNVSKDQNKWSGGTINTATNSQVFEFYMFENKQAAKGSISNYEDREKKVDPNAVNDIEFANASEYATYVILRGAYNGPATVGGSSTNVSAEVSYYVHLGDINKGFTNFETDKNVEYTYRISIKGVNELVWEVETEDPYDRGDGKISLAASTFNLDSHYEVFNITVPKGADYKNDSELTWLSFRIFENNNSSHITQALTPGKEAAWVDVMKYKIINNSTYNEKLITTMEALNNALDTYFKDNPMAENVVLTCYADENLGSDYRECLVYRDNLSANGSTIVRNGFNIRQNYLRKFFDNAGSYYGLEVLNETGRLNNYYNYDVYYFNHAADMSDGLANMKKEVGTTWPSVDQMKTFYAACMSRNRDENGNGRIDDGEMKWYLPAINQYIGMWIGADALQEARLYTLNQASSEWRYVSNSYDNSRGDQWILWGDEGSSTGMKSAGGAASYQLRCIRNIGNPTGDGYYSYTNNVFTMKLVGSGVYRNKQESGELGRSGGHMGTDNKVYSKFKVAKENTGEKLSINGQMGKADKNASVCSEYYEETLKAGYLYEKKYWGNYAHFKRVAKGTGSYNKNSWGMVEANKGEYVEVSASEARIDGGKWRLPNQRELSLMFAKSLLSGTQLSRTFSTFETDRGFGYDTNLRLYPNSEKDSEMFTVRCVRDE